MLKTVKKARFPSSVVSPNKNKVSIKLVGDRNKYKWPWAQVDFDGRRALDPALVIDYISRTSKYPREEDLADVMGFIAKIRKEMEADKKTMRRINKFRDYYRTMPAMTDNLLQELLIKSVQNKKYKSRPSPPFPAKLFSDMFLMGRDGKFYKSTMVGNSWRWISTISSGMSPPFAN